MNKYKEYRQLNLPEIGKEIQQWWKDQDTFKKSVKLRDGRSIYTFYEGPPSANGMPGIHHVMARTIKDIFCRYKTMKGYMVKRKAGWDTHGLPVELGVEKALGITKDDIGTKIPVEEYNKACRKDVLKYKEVWNDLTQKMGYWVDLDNPYITFENKYIESVWWLLNKLYEKDLLYKGFTVQPYSPEAGTGLSTHELNQPGCYKNVKDVSITAQFKLVRNQVSEFMYDSEDESIYILGWTTTPWTLPSNCALAVGKGLTYVKVKTYNPYTHLPVSVILCKDVVSRYFSENAANINLSGYKEGDKLIPYKIIQEYSGDQMLGLLYEQLMPYVKPKGKAFVVISGDFVTSEDGTGIVHTASLFGSDDFRVCRENEISSVLIKDQEGIDAPVVDKKGRFVKEIADFAGMAVKPEYDSDEIRNRPGYKPTDVLIAIKLKEENKAFKIEKYEHSYPHCWRTDKPILYYPLDSWFVKTTELKKRMADLNKTINWKPAHTGSGRFGNWLDNLQDWNLSRSRYWGIPIPIWATEDKSEQLCIGSLEQLKIEADKAVKAGLMDKNPLQDFVPGNFSKQNYQVFDMHKPYVDEVVLVSPSGKKMIRETDLIDVWFDSGAMPYAQFHYPFENKEEFVCNFPADFIAEGVDQTRGWFFTLHAIAVMIFDSVAYKNVISNGLVLDKKGNKMSKRLGNTIDPFATIEKYGPDAMRWYLITNAQPWDNLKFDLEGIDEIKRKFFGTFYNTYAFYALYANLDNFNFSEKEIELAERPEIDRWILSLLNTLIRKVDESYSNYEPTKAGRLIQYFVIENLSNWYVRLCRRRFWKGEYSKNKIAAYQTLYTCLQTVAQLMAPLAPFFSEKVFIDLNTVTGKLTAGSIHLSDFPECNDIAIDKDLEDKMSLAQDVTSMVLSLRKKMNIKVRQPLNKILIATLNKKVRSQLKAVEKLILSEVNVKEIEYIQDTSTILKKRVKPNFKLLGPKLGKNVKALAGKIDVLTHDDIVKIEEDNYWICSVNGEDVKIGLNELEIHTEDIPGWQVNYNEKLTIALDISITEELKEEGIARELVNKIQNLRKNYNFDVVDRIKLKIKEHEAINAAINNNLNYICSETLASSLQLVPEMESAEGEVVEVDDNIETIISISKLN